MSILYSFLILHSLKKIILRNYLPVFSLGQMILFGQEDRIYYQLKPLLHFMMRVF